MINNDIPLDLYNFEFSANNLSTKPNREVFGQLWDSARPAELQTCGAGGLAGERPPIDSLKKYMYIEFCRLKKLPLFSVYERLA